jgi:hypothetical protein
MSPQAIMTKGERDDLLRLIRQRERTRKSGAKQRSAELLADFEHQIGQYYSWDQEPVWQVAYERAQEAIDAANADIRTKCDALGIPRQFQPQLTAYWHSRGENVVASRRAELRRMAKKRIEAIEAAAITEIEQASVTAQTEVLRVGLTSQAAFAFVDKMPALESLMPKLDFKVIEKLTGKSAIEAPKGAVVPLRLVDPDEGGAP